jgi:hypothetical protein
MWRASLHAGSIGGVTAIRLLLIAFLALTNVAVAAPERCACDSSRAASEGAANETFEPPGRWVASPLSDKMMARHLPADVESVAGITGSLGSQQGRAFYGGQRLLSALNPEISLTGDFAGWARVPQFPADSIPEVYGPGWGDRFYLREAEFHIVAPLDPYTRGKFFFGISGEGHFHLGEAYMEWVSLPGNLNLKVGKYRNQFGVLNRWHEHALPQVDRPLVFTSFLGEEGLSGMGISASWLLPRLWAHVNELTLEMISGGDGVSFAAEGGRDRVAVGRLKNYWDLSANAYLEVGLSGALGHNDPEGKLSTRLGGVDLTYKWVPADRALYRTFELRSEWLWSWRQTEQGRIKSWGGYVSVQNRFGARWWGGVRLDYSHLPVSAAETLKSGSVVLTYWQSEFVFLRLQLQRTLCTYGSDITKGILQIVWSMGPHKHEAY